MEYTVVIGGKPEGPYRLDELEGLGIGPETFVRTPGMHDYKEAHEFAELRELFGFSFQQAVPQYFAAFDQRLLAWATDYFFIVTGYVLLMLACFLFIEGKAQRMAFALGGLPLLPLLKLIYGSVAEASPGQATIGKKLLNIKVTDLEGKRISGGRAWLRNLSKLLSALPFCLGFLYSFLNKKQQCFHDIAAGTLVTKERLI